MWWSIILTAFVALTVAKEAFGKGRAAANWSVIKQYRPVHFITSIPILGLVMGAAIGLNVYVPFMDKNPILWAFSALFGWGDGRGQGNIMLSGLEWKWYAIAFLPILLFALPNLARYEEDIFRQGTWSWWDGVGRSLKFGLIHLVMLIPLGTAIALSIGGLWFTYQYFKGGVKRSTIYHAAYNSVIIATLLVAVLLS